MVPSRKGLPPSSAGPLPPPLQTSAWSVLGCTGAGGWRLRLTPSFPQGEAWSLWEKPGRPKHSHTRFCVSEAGIPGSSLRMKTRRLGQPPGSLTGWTRFV